MRGENKVKCYVRMCIGMEVPLNFNGGMQPYDYNNFFLFLHKQKNDRDFVYK